jgi:hypothetical protein
MTTSKHYKKAKTEFEKAFGDYSVLLYKYSGEVCEKPVLYFSEGLAKAGKQQTQTTLYQAKLIVLKKMMENESSKQTYIDKSKKSVLKKKTYTFKEVRKTHENAYKPWTPKLNKELKILYLRKMKIEDLSKHFGRNIGSINSRIIRLGLDKM